MPWKLLKKWIIGNVSILLGFNVLLLSGKIWKGYISYIAYISFWSCLAICLIIILLLGSSRVGSVRLSSYPVLWSSWGNLLQNNNNSNNDNNNDKSVIYKEFPYDFKYVHF